ncbi:hypothetical protein WSM22_44400 [Cytophagales bacterium WSM2-2]|nr:hypothetical protein WSM22_44400 [Cytophagales bacterium WSM2-2]
METNNKKSVFINTVRQLPSTRDIDRNEAILNIFKGVEEYILDTAGTIVASNLEAVTITGYEEWEIIGRHFSIFYSIEDQVKRAYQVDLEKSNLLGYCYVTGIKMKKRNSPFWAKLKLTSVTDENQIVSGYRLTIQDNTHKALYSHNLSLVKDEYLNLFNNPFIGIFKFRIVDFKLLMVNEKAEGLFGKDWSKKFMDTFFVDSSKFDSIIRALSTKGKIENFEFEIVNHLGKKIWVSASCKLFATVGFVEGIIIDVTERRDETERALSLSNELESFIYHASHDLRSPITSIYGLVHLIQKDFSPGNLEKYSKLIEGRLNHLDNILRDIVEIAFNTAVPLQPEKFDFKTELVVIVNALAKIYPNIQQYIEVNQSENVFFKSDLTRLRSILRNIISNSFKYNNRALDDCFVKISVNVSDEGAEITVEDNGIGIASEHTDKIFSLFYKATESYKGNGLGLYIVRSMVSKLKGEIKLQSTIGVGTLFKVFIPGMTEL